MYVVDVRTVEIHRAGNKLRITVGIREHEQSFERNQGICTPPPPPTPMGEPQKDVHSSRHS